MVRMNYRSSQNLISATFSVSVPSMSVIHPDGAQVATSGTIKDWLGWYESGGGHRTQMAAKRRRQCQCQARHAATAHRVYY